MAGGFNELLVASMVAYNFDTEAERSSKQAAIRPNLGVIIRLLAANINYTRALESNSLTYSFITLPLRVLTYLLTSGSEVSSGALISSCRVPYYLSITAFLPSFVFTQ